MIRDTEIPELRLFRDEESRLPLVQRPDLASMVTYGQNESTPVHNWYRFKEGFSSELLETIVHELGTELGKRLTILDPFCGAGTTVLAAQTLAAKGYEIEAVGIERNPFIAFVARTKAAWHSIDSRELIRDGRRILTEAASYSPPLPDLSSIKDGRCISKHIAKRIIAIRDQISGRDATSNALRLGLAAAIEPLSKVRKDGRALRIVERPRRLVNPTVFAQWKAIADDCKCDDRTPRKAKIRIVDGDGRKPEVSGLAESTVDLLFTSPPYPNNIDYSEVYKLELWLMGHVRNNTEFLQLRHSTFRSHPTHDKASLLPPAFAQELDSGRLRVLLRPLLSRIVDSSQRWRATLLKAYFADLWETVSEARKLLRSGGFAVFTVGNSLHGAGDSPFLVPTDLVLAGIASLHGFEVRQISVARNLKRRLSGNHFLRESIVVLKKQNGH